MTEAFADRMQPEEDHDISFTGERLVPGKVDSSLWYEHISRYIFATQFTQGKDVLDAGCGAGYGAAYLASHNAEQVCAVDISSEGILYAKAHYSGAQLHYSVMDILNMGFASSSFDVVVSFEVIEHIQNQERFLSEISRLLRKDGTLIISTPNKGVYRAGLSPNPYHVRELTREDFKNLLENYFSNVQLVTQNFFWGVELSSIEETQSVPPYSSIDRSLSQANKEPEYMLAVCSQNKREAGAIYQKIIQVSNSSDQYLVRLQAEFEERTDWALKLDKQVQSLASAHQSATSQLEDLSTQLQHTQSQLKMLSAEYKNTQAELYQTKEQLSQVTFEEQALKAIIGFVDDAPRVSGRITRLPWPARLILQTSRPFIKRKIPYEFIFRKGLIVASSHPAIVRDLLRATARRYPFTHFTVLADDRLDEAVASQWPAFEFRFFKLSISRDEKKALIRSVIQENYDVCMLMFAGDAHYDFLKLVGMLSGAQYIKVYNEFLNEFYLMAGKPSSALRHLHWRSGQHSTQIQKRVFHFRFRLPGLKRSFNFNLHTNLSKYLMPSQDQVFALLTFIGYCVVIARVFPMLLTALFSRAKRNPFLEE